jgi:hypothetical protein
MDLGKKSKEKLHSCLNLTGTPHVAVPFVFVELHFWVVVVGLPLLVVYEAAGQSTWAPSGCHSQRRHEKLRNWNVMFSISIYLSYCRMEEH